MIELIIAGIGSPFGDDCLGWEVINRLQKKKELQRFNKNQLQLTCCDRPGVHLLTLWREAKNVFLIDAVKTGAKKGSLLYFKNKEIETITPIKSTHAFGLAQAMELGKELNWLPNNLVLYGIEITNVSFQSELSPAIIKSIHLLAEQMVRDIFTVLVKT